MSSRLEGHPPVVYDELETEGDYKGFKPIIETKDLKKGVEEYAEWSYDIDGGRLDVQFDSTKTGIIVIQCYSKDRLKRCPPIVGIYDGDTEQQVIRRLGKPERARIEGVSKSLYYSSLGIFFTLEKEQVYMLGINDTRYRKGN